MKLDILLYDDYLRGKLRPDPMNIRIERHLHRNICISVRLSDIHKFINLFTRCICMARLIDTHATVSVCPCQYDECSLDRVSYNFNKINKTINK